MSNARFSILQARAISDKRITDAQFRTLASLGMYADRDGWCFPSLTRIGPDCNKSKQAAGRDIVNLKRCGYVEVYPQFDKTNGSRRPNKYRLKFDPPVNVDDSTPSTPEVDTPSTPEVDVNVPVNAPPKNGGKPPIDPSALPIDWQMLGDKPVVLPDEKLAKQKDAAALVGMGMGVLAEPAAALVLAFQVERGVVFTESQIKGQRKAAKALIEQKITPALVTAAVKKLQAAGMTVTDLYSITKTAIDLANTPKPSTPPVTYDENGIPESY